MITFGWNGRSQSPECATEWNGRYRDDIRRFVKGDPGMIGAVAARLAGSADIYQASGHLPINSVNFITCELQRQAQRRQRRGQPRRRQRKLELELRLRRPNRRSNHRGVVRTANQEFRRHSHDVARSADVRSRRRGSPHPKRQQHNAYCQDNEISWFDWRLTQKNRSLLRFWQLLIAARRDFHFLPCRTSRPFLRGGDE